MRRQASERNSNLTARCRPRRQEVGTGVSTRYPLILQDPNGITSWISVARVPLSCCIDPTKKRFDAEYTERRGVEETVEKFERHRSRWCAVGRFVDATIVG